MQTVQLVLYIIPNAYILGFRCDWFRAVVLWCWFVRSAMFAAIFAVWLGERQSAQSATSLQMTEHSPKSVR